jgi:hypothetical protein
MADDGVIRITTAFDASPIVAGNEQAAGSTEQAAVRIQASLLKAQMAYKDYMGQVRSQAVQVAEVNAMLGSSAAAGNAQAASAIQDSKAKLNEYIDSAAAAKLQVAELTAAVRAEAAAHAVNAEAIAGETASQTSGISERMAATASLRVLEGGLTGSTRAAGAFLATTLGLGPILQAAFPIIGLVALLEVFARIPEAINKMQDALAGWDKDREKSFKEAIAEGEKLDQVYDRFSKTEAEHAPAPQLVGAAKYEAEISALGGYQGKLAEVQEQLKTFKAALDAANEKVTVTPPGVGPRGTPLQPVKIPAFEVETGAGEKTRSDLEAQLKAINDMRTEEAKKYNQPIPLPLTINFGTSRATVEKQINEFIEATRKEITKLSEAQEETTLTRGAKAPEETAAQQKAETAAAEARVEGRRKAADAEIALEEETNKHLLSIGQITGAQEAAAIGVLNQQKLQSSIDYYQQLDAIRSAQDVREKADPGLDPQIIRNQAAIASLKKEQQTKDIADTDAVAKANLATQLESIDRQIEAIKAVPSATISAERDADAQVVTLRKEALQDTVNAHFTAGKEYDAQYKSLEDAERAFNEATKKASDEATQHKIENLQRETQEEGKAAEEAAKRAQAELDTRIRAQQSQITEQKPEKTGFTGLDLAAVQATQAQQVALAKSTAAAEEKITDDLTAAKVAALSQQQAVLIQMNLSGTLSNEKYYQDSLRIQNEITAAVDANATKQTQIEQKKNQAQITAAQQAFQQQKQLGDQLANAWASQIDTMLFHSKSFGDAITKLWQNMVKTIMENIVKMVTHYIAQQFVMTAAHLAANQTTVASDAAASAQTRAITTASNLKQIEGSAASAAAKAYNALAGIPIIGPVLGAAAAAATFTAVLAFGAFAEQGWDVPSGGPFPTMLHSKEMVLPEHLAEGVRSMTEGGGGGAGEAGGTGGGGSAAGSAAVNLHYHAGDVHALDGTGVSDVLARHPAQLTKLVNGLVRSGRITPRSLARYAR